MQEKFKIEEIENIESSGKALIQSFFVCLRMSRLYPPTNSAYQKPLSAFAEKLKEFLMKFGNIRIVLAEGQIYLNDIRLKLESSGYEWANEFVGLFEEKGIGGIRILSIVSEETITGFIEAFNSLPKIRNPKEADNRAELLKKLMEKGIHDILPLRMMSLVEDEDEQGEYNPVTDSVQSYLGGIFSLKQLSHGGKGMGNGSGFVQITRTVQEISDAQDKIGDNILSLVTIRNCGNFLLTHSMNVCIISMVIGKRLGLCREDLCDLSIGALIHDVGKFQLQKENDIKNYHKHPYESFKFIVSQEEPSKSMITKALIGLDHHISYDGKKGFPEFRLGNIPHIFSRIVSVADCYDQLTSQRGEEKQNYVLPDVAMKIILKRAEDFFDPLVARVLFETLGKYPVGTLVEIDNGDIGIVVQSGKGSHRLLRPRVLLIKDRYGNEIKQKVVLDLSEKHPKRNAFLYSIVCSHDPAKLGINISGYLLDFLSSQYLESSKAEQT